MSSTHNRRSHSGKYDGIVLVILAASLAVGVTLSAQRPPPLVKEGATVKVSPHVYVILDDDVPTVPNVGLIVGTTGTLVVDTGLGPRNGDAVLREVAKVSDTRDLYLVATHFHPEHAGGSSAFPASAKFIVSAEQQKDLDELGLSMAARFASRSAIEGELLQDVAFRRPDVSFEDEYRLDLGGVTVRLLSVGPTHTRGDTVAFVEDDRVLFAGDLLFKNRFPAFAEYSSAQAWVQSLQTLAALDAAVIVPSHGPMADGSSIEAHRLFLERMQARVRELKAQGRTADEIAPMLTEEFVARHPDWRFTERIANIARSVFEEVP